MIYTFLNGFVNVSSTVILESLSNGFSPWIWAWWPSLSNPSTWAVEQEFKAIAGPRLNCERPCLLQWQMIMIINISTPKASLGLILLTS